MNVPVIITRGIYFIRYDHNAKESSFSCHFFICYGSFASEIRSTDASDTCTMRVPNTASMRPNNVADNFIDIYKKIKINTFCRKFLEKLKRICVCTARRKIKRTLIQLDTSHILLYLKKYFFFLLKYKLDT